jgi:Tfp pilus assembly protein PilV
MPKTSVALPHLVMIRTISARLRVLGRFLTGGSVRTAVGSLEGIPVARGPLASEAGDTLMEVLISTLLVGLIVVGTLTGFNAVNRTSTDQRQHNEAALLAAQSQEQLRTAPASTLELLQATPHLYAQTIGGTVYKILQKTELQPASGSGAICSVTETKRQSGNAFRITSTVTWPTLGGSKKVNSDVASSLVTPPTGSALEVDVGNAPEPTSGVSGITAVVMYTPVGGGEPVTVEQTTGTEGCVVFAGIPATTATVEIRELAGYVTRSGAPKFPTKEVKIAPNYTTHYAVTYNRGGAIKGEFAYNNSTGVRKHLNNEGKTPEIEEAPSGDTFLAFNAKMEAKPDYEVASTRYAEPTAGVYNPLSSTSSATYEAFGTSLSILFPFTEAEKSPWLVYAGDCAENNPEKLTGGAIKPSSVYVTPGGVVSALVPTSYVTLNLYKGNEAQAKAEGWKNLETTISRPVTITNLKCAGATAPNNESAPSIKHVQATTINTTSPNNGGHLARPFQPFGAEFELCVAGAERTYRVKYENKALTGGNVSIYLLQRPLAEVEKEREAKESAYGAKKSAYETEKTKYTTEKTKYETEKTKYTTEKTKYTTEKANWESKKTEPYKKNYETAEKEYKKAETEYKKAETEYKNAETEYKNAETEYESDKAAYEKAKTEEKEGTSVTVEKGTVCP